ncbi:MAG: hypothetical protein MJZ34_06975 [Paludibacteraceae bacterium]|nr:hypothetical protein [Paludibacteraceae bacterium]
MEKYDVDTIDESNWQEYIGKKDLSVKFVKLRKCSFNDNKLPFTLNKCEMCWVIDCNLKSLEGFPKEVVGNFYCSENPLKNLVGSPKIVGGNYYCDNCRLECLEGAPERIGNGDNKEASFYCYDNKLETLKGAPRYVCGDFDCSGNYITSLEHSPDYVGGSFICDDGNIPSEMVSVQNERYNKLRILHKNFNDD